MNGIIDVKFMNGVIASDDFAILYEINTIYNGEQHMHGPSGNNHSSFHAAEYGFSGDRVTFNFLIYPV